jgi:xyloglucan-specific exo-beta-1,4-glucanase
VAEVGYSGGDWSTDGGATWTAMRLPPGSSAGAGVVAVSADGSRIVWAPVDAPPAHSADGGQTWTAVTGLARGLMPVADPVQPGVCYAFDPADGTVLKSTGVGTVATLGFGRAAPGAGYPAIYLTGIVGGVQGIFRFR